MIKERNYEFPILAIAKEEYDIVQSWIEKYKTSISEKELYIFGAGIRGNMMLKLLEEAGICVAGFYDNNVEKQGAFIKEYKIYSPQTICDNHDKKCILISTENSYEIEKFLETNGFIKDINYFVLKNKQYDCYLNNFNKKENIEYILFGDCYFTDLDIDDLKDKSMGELALEKLGENKSKVLSIHGMCIPGFYYLMKMQLELGIRPKAVGFIVNIPFCNSIQTKLPQSQHPELFKMIQENISVQNDEFDQYVKLTETRAQNINARSFSTKNRVKDDKYIDKMLIRARYMYQFDEENENIVYLKKMIQLLQRNHIKAVPFIPALNYHVGIDFYGDEFITQYSAICEQIKKCAASYEVELLDMSFLLDKECYLGSRMTKFPDSKGKDKEISVLCNRIQAVGENE